MFRVHRRGFWGLLPAVGLMATGWLTGCNDDNPAGPAATTFRITLENVSGYAYAASGVFNTPVGASDPGPAGPGGAYEFRVGAAPGARLSFALMFVQSNDLFYAPGADGIDLYDGSGNPVSGDVTDRLMLWDAGTEVNQEPGVGVDQAPRQGGANRGAADPDTRVRAVDDGFTYPSASEVIRATVTPEGGGVFRVRLENVSTGTTLALSGGGTTAVPLAPGVYVVHTGMNPLFTSGTADPGDGLEALAEDGNPGPLAAALAPQTGVNTPFAPGVFAVHTASGALFTPGMAAGGGLESLAEDGNPGSLAATLTGTPDVTESGVFNTPDGAAGPGPLLPGESYSFTFSATAGDRLSFATMFVQSNDLFIAPASEGIDLFPGGSARTGDVTGRLMLWDAGTEANQWPGAGPDQAPRQAGPDTGPADPNAAVRTVQDGFTYPPLDGVLRVTLAVVR